MGKIVKSALKVGLVIGGAILGTVLLGPVIGTSLGMAVGAAIGNAAGQLLLPMKPKQPRLAEQEGRLLATPDLQAPRKMVLGRTAMATDIRYEVWDTATNPTYLYRIVGVASHKVQSIEEIWFDNELVWTVAGGVIAKYASYLTVTVRLEGTAGNAIPIDAQWDANSRLTGCAYVYFRYRVKKLNANDENEQPPFISSITNRMTIIGNGLILYDPRLDTTVGGSGAHRAGNQATRTFVSNTQQKNLPLLILNYLLGWKINNVLSVGKGIPPERFDMSSFITAANIAEESVTRAVGGSEPRYMGSAVAAENEDASTVLSVLSAACNAILTDAGGKISIQVLTNDLASYVVDYTDDDFLGEYTWEPWRDLQATPNIVRGQYTDPSEFSLYQARDYSPVGIASADGIDRYETLNYTVIESPSQAQRLAKQYLQRIQNPGVFTAPMKLTGLNAGIGKVVRITFSPLGWVNKLFRVAEHRVGDGQLTLVFNEENTSFYAWDNEDTAVVQPADNQIFDPATAPLLSLINNIEQNVAETLADLAEFANDNILTNEEKKVVRVHYGAAVAEQADIDAKATSFGITTEKTTYDTALAALITYITALSPNLTSTSSTPIVRTTWNSKWGDHYAARQALLNKIDASAKALADAAQTTANTAVTNAATAQATANTANAAIADIASDSLLTPDEKPRIIQDRDVIVAEQAGIDTQATAFSITTEKTAYDTSVSALTTYLATLTTPVLWSNLSGNTTIVGATFRTKFADVYAARQVLLNKIAEVAATRANWSGVVDTGGKPSDYAGTSLTLEAVSGTFTIRGNTAIKTSASGTFTNAWSREWLRGTASISGFIGTTDTILGLSTTRGGAVGDVAAGILRHTDGHFYAVIAGVSGTDFGTGFSSTTDFRIVYDGQYYSFYADGAFLIRLPAANRLAHVGGASIAVNAGTVTSIQFSPFTEIVPAGLTPIGSFTYIVGNSIQKFGGTHGAEQGGVVGPSQNGTCFVACNLVSDGLSLPGGSWQTRVALDDDATSFTVAAARFETVFTNSTSTTGSLAVYENGTQIPGSPFTIGVVAVTSQLAAVYDGIEFRAMIDGAVIARTPAPSNLALWPKVLDFHQTGPGRVIRNIKHGPWTDSSLVALSLGENRIFNGNAELGTTSGWVYDPSFGTPVAFSADVGSASNGKYGFVASKSALADHFSLVGRSIEVVPGKKYVVRINLNGSTATASGLFIRMNEKASAPTNGTHIFLAEMDDSTDLANNVAWPSSATDYSFVYTVPAGITHISPTVIDYTNGPLIIRFDDFVMGESAWGPNAPEDNADVTLTAQVVVMNTQQVTVNADQYGAVLALQLPRVLTPTVTKGGVDKRTDSLTTYAVSNLTGGCVGNVTVNNTGGSADKGRQTISTGLTSSGTYDLTVTYNGVAQPFIRVHVTKVNADPPSGGGGGGSPDKSGSFDPVGLSATSTTLTEIGRISGLVKATGETIRAYFNADYQTSATNNASRTMTAQWQWSVAGANSWNAFTAPASSYTGSASFWNQGDFEADTGSITCNQTAAPADGTYDVRVCVSESSTTNSSNVSVITGTASVAIGP
jgi:hypothetical protein